MGTLEIILCIVQGAVLPIVGWVCLSIIDNIRRIGAIEAKLELYFDLVGLKAVKTLHSPHTPEFDQLLDRWLETTNGLPHAAPMTEDELLRFVHKLELAEAEKGDYFRSHQAAVLRAIVLAKYPKLKDKKA